MAKIVVPRAIRRQNDGVFIDWDAKGHQALFLARALRLSCPCARCVDEMSGRPILDPASVPEDVAPDQVALVGGYAIQITWSDGHSSGIFPFDMLLARCPCPSCRKA